MYSLQINNMNNVPVKYIFIDKANILDEVKYKEKQKI